MAWEVNSNVHQIVWEPEIPSEQSIRESPSFDFDGFNAYFELRHVKAVDGVYYELYMKKGNTYLFGKASGFGTGSVNGAHLNFTSYIEDSNVFFFRTQCIILPCSTCIRKFAECNPFVDFKSKGKLKIVMILGFETTILKCGNEKSFRNVAVGADTVPDSNKSLQDIESVTLEHSNLDLLSLDFSKLLEGDLYPDVVVDCCDQTFKAHRAVLCSRSEVFLAMLQSDMLEGQTARIEVKGMKSDICKDLLHYIYSGKLLKLTSENARDLYEAGDRYNVGGLMKPCAIFLTKNLARDNACDMLVLADAHSDQDFKENVIEYILDKEIPLEDDLWKSFCLRHPLLATEVLNRSYRLQKQKRN